MTHANCKTCGHLGAGACRATSPNQCPALTPEERGQMRRAAENYRRRVMMAPYSHSSGLFGKWAGHEMRASTDRVRKAARARYVASLAVDLEPPTGRQRRYC